MRIHIYVCMYVCMYIYIYIMHPLQRRELLAQLPHLAAGQAQVREGVRELDVVLPEVGLFLRSASMPAFY